MLPEIILFIWLTLATLSAVGSVIHNLKELYTKKISVAAAFFIILFIVLWTPALWWAVLSVI